MVGVLVRFCVLRPWASCLGILAWFGHLPGRAANVTFLLQLAWPPGVIPQTMFLYNTKFLKSKSTVKTNLSHGSSVTILCLFKSKEKAPVRSL